MRKRFKEGKFKAGDKVMAESKKLKKFIIPEGVEIDTGKFILESGDVIYVELREYSVVANQKYLEPEIKAVVNKLNSYGIDIIIESDDSSREVFWVYVIKPISGDSDDSEMIYNTFYQGLKTSKTFDVSWGSDLNRAFGKGFFPEYSVVITFKD